MAGLNSSELNPRFKIRAPLRCDGIGRLDCAEDLDSGVRMAVRWLPLEANGDAAARAVQKLPEHPTLPRIRQTGQVGASAFMAMDFPDGQLLATLDHAELDAAMLIGVTAQIADALSSIHSQGVFHGELSNESILLVKPERAYLWDMPLVIANRLTDRRGEERLMQKLVHAAPYLAPERARGKTASPEADVYALGAIVCIAGGAVGPAADTTLGIVHQVANGLWSPKVPKRFPEPLRSMLERMVSREPEDRPTAREVAELFTPPAASSATIPEMAAIVLPDPVVVAPSVVVAPVLEEKAVEAQPVEVLAAPAVAFAPAAAPTMEVPVVVSPNVALTDNIEVSAELAASSLVLSKDEAAALDRARSKKVAFALAGAFAAVLVILGGVAGWLANRPGPVTVAAAPAVVAPKKVVAAPVPAVEVTPAAAATVDDDALLSPLAPKGAAKKAAARKAQHLSDVAPSDVSASSEVPAAPETPFVEKEFEQLGTDDVELKRPSF